MVQLTSRTQHGSGTAQRNYALCRGARSCVRSTAVRCFKGGSDEIGSKQSTTLRLNFKIPYRVNFGQSLGLVGSGESLGNWDPKRTVQMKWTDGDWWTVELNVAPGRTLDLEYKYVVVNADGNIGYWKPGSNYRVTLPLHPSSASVPKRVKVADAWDDSFKKVDIEEAEIPSAPASSSTGSAAKPLAAQEQPLQSQPVQESRQQPAPAPPIGATAAPAMQAAQSTSTAPPVPEPKAASNGAPPPSEPSTSGSQQTMEKSPRQPRATSPRSVPPNFAAVTSIPAIHPSLLAEQERLEDGVKNSLEDLQAQMDKHQQLRERTDDPAAVEILVADRIVAAANNRVVAYNKALKAVQEYNRLPPSASAPKEAASDVDK